MNVLCDFVCSFQTDVRNGLGIQILSLIHHHFWVLTHTHTQDGHLNSAELRRLALALRRSGDLSRLPHADEIEALDDQQGQSDGLDYPGFRRWFVLFNRDHFDDCQCFSVWHFCPAKRCLSVPIFAWGSLICLTAGLE